ncbi:MAG: tetratricopeptide repeat protein [Rhodospirillales bacterium]
MSPGSTSQQAGSTDRPADAGAVRALLKAGKLIEAEAAVGAALAAAPGRPALLRVAAAVAEHRGDLEATLARWEAVRAAEPGEPTGFIGALRSLRRLGRIDLAEPILREGRARLWDNVEFVVMAAQVATTTKKVEEAEQAWRRATELAPDNPEYALSAAMALIGPRKGRRKRLRVVAQRLEQHHQQFASHVPAYTAHVDVLRLMLALPDADRLSAEWCARFPNDVKLALARAGVHEDLGRLDEVLAEVTALRARTPPSPEVEAAYIRALSGVGRYADAEAACEAARRSWPKERAVWLEYARIASRRADWAESVRRLEQAREAMPKDEALARELRTLRAQLADPDSVPAPQPSEGLFGHFESLGGTGMGCEFAMVQRRLGTDALGLLRWARTEPPEMIAALDSEFAGVGDEENTELNAVRVAADREEYVTRDKRYLMESHTFVRTVDAPADKMFQQTCRRLRFLRGKLLEDLRAGEKIFVYRAEEPIEDDVVVALHAAVARYGDNTLLCVMRAGTEHTPRTLRVLGPGIFVGYVSHFLRDTGDHRGSDIEGWTAVCAEAHRLWREAGVEDED